MDTINFVSKANTLMDLSICGSCFWERCTVPNKESVTPCCMDLLGDCLGSGVTACVYKLKTDSPYNSLNVVIKVFNRNVQADENYTEDAFIKEIRSHLLYQQRLSCRDEGILRLNEHIATAVGVCNIHRTIILPYVNGTSLEQWLLPSIHSKHRSIQCSPSLRERNDLITQLIEVTKAIHSIGLYHGDLKSKNVMVISGNSTTWKVVLIDLGESGGFDYTIPCSVRLSQFEFGRDPCYQDCKQLLWVMLQVRFGFAYYQYDGYKEIPNQEKNDFRNFVPTVMVYDEDNEDIDLSPIMYVLCGPTFFVGPNPEEHQNLSKNDRDLWQFSFDGIEALKAAIFEKEIDENETIYSMSEELCLLYIKAAKDILKHSCNSSILLDQFLSVLSNAREDDRGHILFGMIR